MDKGISLDVETTGTLISVDRIVQLAIQKTELDVETNELRATKEPGVVLVNPRVPIPAEATEIHGITDADVGDERHFSDFAKHVSNLMFFSDYFVGYNLRFDVGIICEELKRASIPPDVIKKIEEKPRLDGYHIWRTLEPRTLADACRKFHVKLDKAHDAGADTAATTGVVRAMLAGISREQLGDILSNKLNDTPADYIGKRGALRQRWDGVYMAIGKHKGDCICSVPTSYLRWMVNRGDFDPEVVAEITKELETR